MAEPARRRDVWVTKPPSADDETMLPQGSSATGGVVMSPTSTSARDQPLLAGDVRVTGGAARHPDVGVGS
jgi:hypothetical protein